jgi:hypothetical protein
MGACKDGMRTCSAEGAWGACDGQVLPSGEVCGNGLDENCSGMADESTDLDGDGYTTCDGDCCDSTAGCDKPELVSPGAIDVAGNNLDDDCDGTKDNVLATECDESLQQNSGNAMDYAKAMELCQQTSETATGKDRKWGVLSAKLVLADGNGTPAAAARSILTSFGGTAVQAGKSFSVFSTGEARINAPYETSLGNLTNSAAPADWIGAHGGSLPDAPGCLSGDVVFGVNDPVMLELKVRVPSNAKSFSFQSNFFSSEYPEWVCTTFNDFFVVLLDSTFAGTPANPTDKNLAIYKAPGGQTYPVGVNLAHNNTGLFRECTNGTTGCSGASTSANSSCTSTTGLVGTGFDAPKASACFPPNASEQVGGATGWLTTAGNVKGGETITLRIAIWDTGDSAYDSLVLLDNFKWSLEAAMPGTVIE